MGKEHIDSTTVMAGGSAPIFRNSWLRAIFWEQSYRTFAIIYWYSTCRSQSHRPKNMMQGRQAILKRYEPTWISASATASR
jgi:hypothetical protein